MSKVDKVQRGLELLREKTTELFQVHKPVFTGREEKIDAKTHLIQLRQIFTPMCAEFVQGVRAKLALGQVSIPTGDELGAHHIQLHKIMKETTEASVRTWLEMIGRKDENITPGTLQEFGVVVANDTELLAKLVVEAQDKVKDVYRRLGITNENSMMEFDKYIVDVSINTLELGFNDESGDLAIKHTLNLKGKRFDSCFWGPPCKGQVTGSPFMSDLVAPVGDYGEDLAKKIFTATRILLEQTREESLLERSRQIAAQHPEVIQNTVRGNDKLNLPEDIPIPQEHIPKLPFDEAPLRTFIEGLGTLPKSLSLLTAQKMPGYNDPSQLVADLITNSVPNHLARVIGPAVINPLIIGNIGIRDLIVIKDGKPIINPEIEQKADKYRVDLQEKPAFGFRPPAVGRGCPVAYRENGGHEKSGIEQISDLFLEIFNLV